jgi:futalosine hydrolase
MGRGAEIVGFGPVLAGVRTARLLALERPRRVVLAGVAGTYDARRLPVGSVLRATEVRREPVGRAEGARTRGARALGFDAGPERIRLPARPRLPGTVAGALQSVARAGQERTVPRGVLAEDMEAHAVALACLEAGVPLVVLRGISNVVGTPRRSWRIPEALRALAAVLPSALRGPS